MTTALSSLDHITSILAFEIYIPRYRTSATAFPTEQTLRFNDSVYNLTINGETSYGAGPLLTLSSTVSEIRPNSDDFSFTLSGIPQDRIKEVIHSEIKGSEVRVSRVFCYPGTKQIITDLDLSTGGTVGRYRGRVSVYSIEDTIDPLTGESSIVITFECNSQISLLKNLVRGMRTNPVDLRYLTSDVDVSFDRVPNLKYANISWGITGDGPLYRQRTAKK